MALRRGHTLQGRSVRGEYMVFKVGNILQTRYHVTFKSQVICMWFDK